MAKRKQEKFDEAGLVELTKRLKAHRAKLVAMIRACPVDVDFDGACTLRDAAQFLVTTCLTIEFIAGTLAGLVKMAGPQAVPHLSECGLDWKPEDGETQ